MLLGFAAAAAETNESQKKNKTSSICFPYYKFNHGCLTTILYDYTNRFFQVIRTNCHQPLNVYETEVEIILILQLSTCHAKRSFVYYE